MASSFQAEAFHIVLKDASQEAPTVARPESHKAGIRFAAVLALSCLGSELSWQYSICATLQWCGSLVEAWQVASAKDWVGSTVKPRCLTHIESLGASIDDAACTGEGFQFVKSVLRCK